MTATGASLRVSMPEKLVIKGMDISTSILEDPGEGHVLFDLDNPAGTEKPMRPKAASAFFGREVDFRESLLGVATPQSQSRDWGGNLKLRGLDEQSMRIWPSLRTLIDGSLRGPSIAFVRPVERIGLVKLHRWHLRVPHYLEAARWSIRLQRTGKIQHIGGISFGIAHVREQVEACAPPNSTRVQCFALTRWLEAFSRNSGSAHQHPLIGSKPILSDQPMLAASGGYAGR